jgi:hypothetical protein
MSGTTRDPGYCNPNIAECICLFHCQYLRVDTQNFRVQELNIISRMILPAVGSHPHQQVVSATGLASSVL